MTIKYLVYVIVTTFISKPDNKPSFRKGRSLAREVRKYSGPLTLIKVTRRGEGALKPTIVEPKPVFTLYIHLFSTKRIEHNGDAEVFHMCQEYFFQNHTWLLHFVRSVLVSVMSSFFLLFF